MVTPPSARKEAFIFSNERIEPGSRKIVDIPLSRLADHTRMTLSVDVIHGKLDGPVMFVSGAIHGDEIIGVEIIRRVAEQKILNRLRGTLILVPIVNAYGFITHSRYLPDRRDLNRSFPGNSKGSLAAQLAYTFMQEVVQHCHYGIDIHSGAIHRANLNQIRADFSNLDVKAMAEAFGAAVMLNSQLRDGSLREAAQAHGCQTLLYEAGEALRFDELPIRVGVKGVLNVMRHVGMLNPAKSVKSDSGKTLNKKVKSVFCKTSQWIRAPIGGILRPYKALGDRVHEGEIIAIISGPLGQQAQEITAPINGIVIGRANMPILNRGDAIFHIASVTDTAKAAAKMGEVESEAERDPIFVERDIV